MLSGRNSFFQMQGNANITQPLTWEQFEKLMLDMTAIIQSSEDRLKRKYAMYQTGIACGAYLGPTTNELLSIRWCDIKGVGAYIFKLETHRSPIVIPTELRVLIKKNYDILRPFSTQEFVIKDAFKDINKPIWGGVFNNVFLKILDQHGIDIPCPSVQTLRKTFARQTYLELGSTPEAIDLLAHELNYTRNNIANYIKIRSTP